MSYTLEDYAASIYAKLGIDMEERFSKEYSSDHIRHDFREPIFQLVRGGDFLFAAPAGGQVKQYAIEPPLAVFDINQAKTVRSYAGQSDQLFTLDVSSSTQRIAAAGFGPRQMVTTSDKESRNRC